jgi:hypothetical protein
VFLLVEPSKTREWETDVPFFQYNVPADAGVATPNKKPTASSMNRMITPVMID